MVVGCSFGMMLRPDPIATAEAWDAHVEQAHACCRRLLERARELNPRVAIENHLDFTTEELRDFIRAADSPHAGVIFDTGNPFGILDDPAEAADRLGPHTAATHLQGTFPMCSRRGHFYCALTSNLER